MRNAFYCEGPAWLCKGQRFCCENNEASVSSYVWHSALGIEIMTIIIIKTMKVIIMQLNVMQHNDDNNNYNDNYINDHNDINDNSIQLKSRPNIYIYIYIHLYIYIFFFISIFWNADINRLWKRHLQWNANLTQKPLWQDFHTGWAIVR